MRLLLVECYAFLYKFTRAKLFSYWFALVYISLLACYTLGGLCMLASGWLHALGSLLILFRFPFFVATMVLLGFVIYKISPKMKQISKDAKKQTGYSSILVFTIFSLLLFVYMKYGDTIFPDSHVQSNTKIIPKTVRSGKIVN